MNNDNPHKIYEEINFLGGVGCLMCIFVTDSLFLAGALSIFGFINIYAAHVVTKKKNTVHKDIKKNRLSRLG